MNGKKFCAGSIIEHGRFYYLFHSLWTRKKISPLLKAHSFNEARSLIDIGCGPGLYYPFFCPRKYLGIDLSNENIAFAGNKFGSDKYMVADARYLNAIIKQRFDAVLINSLLHHLSDEDVLLVFKSAASLVEAEGKVYIIDLVLPQKKGLPYFLAKADNGQYARERKSLISLASQDLSIESSEDYCISLFGVELWKMIFVTAVPRKVT